LCRFALTTRCLFVPPHPRRTPCTSQGLISIGTPIPAVTLDDAGTNVKAEPLPTDSDRIAVYVAALPGNHPVAVECTTDWYWLSDLCHDLDIALVLAHMKYPKAIAYTKVKTDAAEDGVTGREANRISGILRRCWRPGGAQVTGSKPGKGSGRQERPVEMHWPQIA